ncbi:hypothetical protein DENSPDRAFT_233993 [Dentipellis sp. KUC8613]|nr:hypothetical protein DENSPDRAFT_233993 [Dentipellis sp. KUC8613]
MFTHADRICVCSPTFPSTCLSPDQPGYGQVVNNGNGRRRARRNTTAQTPALMPGEASSITQGSWTIMSAGPSQPHNFMHHSGFAHMNPSSFPPTSYTAVPLHRPPTGYRQNVDASLSSISASPTEGGVDRGSQQSQRSRFSPYPGPPSSASYAGSLVSSKGSPVSIAYKAPSDPFITPENDRRASETERVTLPPIQLPYQARGPGQPQVSLPPISTFADCQAPSHDSRDVLKRLQADDDRDRDDFRPPTEEQLWRRRRSISAPPYEP